MKIISSNQYADTIGIKRQTPRLQRMRGIGPPFFRMTDSPNARVYYRLEDVEQWLASRPSYRSTAEEKATLHAARKNRKKAGRSQLAGTRTRPVTP